ncbi:hypothetical protein ADZ36_03275 [Streptomyces fradiae]|uniref:Uncharacterized protein n=3 Tax=Streptomyces TaxID=1883 RepID=A0A420V0A1_9ACTN|nr:hypothetical protein ADZ36_03275 [Streptomyces fradiae]OFA51093.1 hypothetical protein BEN35_14145 [Streptomyces fradiae]PQM20294.1 hypothetical protein Sfr7A_28075 [Streptomyces xinghaiensis]RKM93934.1 hypothetical protein SFRA_019095 [Streptomyces xinghaiensis]RNC69437.1 hypothetical protein DC095_029095 [Streptomyces xinghaiensis]
MPDQALRVVEAEEVPRVPWTVRFRLWTARRRDRTGLLLHAAIRDPIRSPSRKWCVVMVELAGEPLASADRTSRLPKFAQLPSGRHALRFHVVRARWSTVFEKTFRLERGDVLLASCEPVQPKVFYRRSPRCDTWTLFVIKPHGSGSEEARRIG